MGRTNATYRNHLDKLMEKFKPFRKGLRKENKQYLDMLWEKSHEYASAAAYMNPTNPSLPAMISMMLGIQKQLEQNKQKIQEIEQKIEKIEDGIQD
ncbi:hypothetical protein GLU60_00925 [Nanohaloarchaea archaeon H01]|nr:hypothetical protein [Nanohaloarchaea archaeon H01]